MVSGYKLARKNQYEFKEDYIVLRVFSRYGDLKCFIDYDSYIKVKEYHWYVVKFKTCSTLYLQARKKNTKITLHRLVTDCPKEMQVDHINHNGLDNRLSNLKICSQIENLKNRRPSKNRGKFPIKNISIQETRYKNNIYKYYKVNKNGIIKTFKNLEDAEYFLKEIK